MTKLISFETWLPIDESILHTESVADFFSLIHSYSNVLSELIKEDTVKAALHGKVDGIFTGVFRRYISFTIDSLSWIQPSSDYCVLRATASSISNQVFIPMGPIQYPSTSDVKNSVESLEKISTRLSNMFFIKQSLTKNKEKYQAILSSETSFSSLIQMIDLNTPSIVTKFSFQFY